MRIKGQLANTGSPGKWPLKRSVCAAVMRGFMWECVFLLQCIYRVLCLASSAVAHLIKLIRFQNIC